MHIFEIFNCSKNFRPSRSRVDGNEMDQLNDQNEARTSLYRCFAPHLPGQAFEFSKIAKCVRKTHLPGSPLGSCLRPAANFHQRRVLRTMLLTTPKCANERQAATHENNTNLELQTKRNMQQTNIIAERFKLHMRDRKYINKTPQEQTLHLFKKRKIAGVNLIPAPRRPRPPAGPRRRKQ